MRDFFLWKYYNFAVRNFTIYYEEKNSIAYAADNVSSTTRTAETGKEGKHSTYRGKRKANADDWRRDGQFLRLYP